MAQGDQILRSVDSYAAILDELEGRMVANTTAMLRTAVVGVLELAKQELVLASLDQDPDDDVEGEG